MGLNSRQHAYTESKEDQREGFVLFFLRLLRKYVEKSEKMSEVSKPSSFKIPISLFFLVYLVITFISWVGRGRWEEW